MTDWWVIDFPRGPRLVGTRMSPFWILLEQGWWPWWSYKTCKAPVKSPQSTNQHPACIDRIPFLSPNKQCHSIVRKTQTHTHTLVSIHYSLNVNSDGLRKRAQDFAIHSPLFKSTKQITFLFSIPVLLKATAKVANSIYKQAVGERPPQYAPAHLLPLSRPPRMQTATYSSRFPRPMRSHGHRCSCLTH